VESDSDDIAAHNLSLREFLMGRLLHQLWDICLLRSGPQDLPYSPRLLLIVCAISLLLQMLLASVLGATQDSLGTGILSLVFNFGVLYLLLSLRGLSGRFFQAALALVSCALVFSVLSLPIALLTGSPPVTADQITPLQILLGLVSLPLLVWKVLVDAHILRHSLNVPFLSGIIIAVLWLIGELALNAVSGTASPGA
jgi:hypothetical protein